MDMNIRIICVGKIKERYFSDALSEYIKRLGAYVKIIVMEIPDEPDRCGMKREGEGILSKLKDKEHVIALAIDGKKYSSEAFSDHIERLSVSGKSDIAFIIGGSYGLSDAVLLRSDEKISFSDMTFPHQLMRVILCEQIYRAFRIINHEPYHK